MSDNTFIERHLSALTHLTERGRVPISLPSTCLLSVYVLHSRSIGRDTPVGSCIAPFNHALKLFIGPGIEINGLDSADMRAHTPVNARAPNADKYTEIPRSPSRIC